MPWVSKVGFRPLFDVGPAHTSADAQRGLWRRSSGPFASVSCGSCQARQHKEFLFCMKLHGEQSTI